MSSPRKIGFIGLGLMGRPMAMNLLKAGHTLTVWNRTSSRAQELVAAGATLAKSPREAAAASDILFTIVSDPPALEEVLWGHQGNNDGAMAGLRPGSIYIDSPSLLLSLAALLLPAPSMVCVISTRPSPAAIGALAKAISFS